MSTRAVHVIVVFRVPDANRMPQAGHKSDLVNRSHIAVVSEHK